MYHIISFYFLFVLLLSFPFFLFFLSFTIIFLSLPRHCAQTTSLWVPLGAIRGSLFQRPHRVQHHVLYSIDERLCCFEVTGNSSDFSLLPLPPPSLLLILFSKLGSIIFRDRPLVQRCFAVVVYLPGLHAQFPNWNLRAHATGLPPLPFLVLLLFFSCLLSLPLASLSPDINILACRPSLIRGSFIHEEHWE